MQPGGFKDEVRHAHFFNELPLEILECENAISN